MAGAGNRKGQIALGVAVAAVAALAAFFTLRDQAGPVDPPLAATPEAPAPEAAAQEQAVPQTDAAVADQPAGPRFDSVRIKVGEVSVIAGRSVPGGVVDILIDQVAVARADVDSSGTFVALIDIGPSATPRTLSLLADPEGAKILSDETLLIEPTTVQVAQAEAEAVAEPAEIVAETVAQDTPAEAAQGTDPAAIPPADAPAANVEQTADEGADTQTPDQTLAEDGAPVENTTPAVLVANEDGVRVLQPAGAAPEVAAAVALDSIAYDPSGTVVLAGRATGGAGTVRIYLDNSPLTETPVLPSGNWSVDLPQVDTGLHTLRVDEVAADGTVMSRIETPFQREEPSAVAAVMADQTKTESFNVAVKTVQPGATLWAIARERYGSGVLYVRVFEANRDRIRDPNLIYPGQVFLMPEDGQ